MKLPVVCIIALASVFAYSQECYKCVTQSKVYAVSFEGDVLCERKQSLRGIKIRYTATNIRACEAIQQQQTKLPDVHSPGFGVSEAVAVPADAYTTTDMIPTESNLAVMHTTTLTSTLLPTTAVATASPDSVTDAWLSSTNEELLGDDRVSEDFPTVSDGASSTTVTSMDEKKLTADFGQFDLGTPTQREQRAFRSMCRTVMLIDRLGQRKRFRGTIIGNRVFAWNNRSAARNYTLLCNEMMMAHKLRHQ